MKRDWKNWIRQKLQEAFLTAVRAALNDQKAARRAEAVREKFPGMPRDMLAEILIKRAVRKTMAEGAATGAVITAAEAAAASPVPEGGQRPAAGYIIAAALAADVSFTTKIQMQLLLEIGEVYDCPFRKDDEDDVWQIFKAALGIKGTERASIYGRFVFTEAAEKQFRRFLRSGIRRAAQEFVRKVAGKEVAKYVSEKVLMNLIPVANAFISAAFNRWVTRRVGKWARVKAKIRASTFGSLEHLNTVHHEVAILSLPVIYVVGRTMPGETTDNILSLYAQTSNRLELTDRDIEQIERLIDSENPEDSLLEQLRSVTSQIARTHLLNIGITAAAASRLNFNETQHTCLQRLSNALGENYSREDLKRKIAHLYT